MEKYKVIFTDNIAVSAIPAELYPNKHVQISMGDGKRSIEWFIVYAHNEQDAIYVANKIISENIWQQLISGKLKTVL